MVIRVLCHHKVCLLRVDPLWWGGGVGGEKMAVASPVSEPIHLKGRFLS